MTHKKQLDMHKSSLIGYCVEEIQNKLEKNACPNIEFVKFPTAYIFRCKKPNVQRSNFWDTWWFRLTPSGQEYHPGRLEVVLEHTICIDGRHRLEAYPTAAGALGME